MIDPLYLFVFAGLFSPGPNVILLTASGARFGVRRTVPHILGVALGVGVTAGLTGLGIGALLATQPGIEWILKLLAAGWILWMARTLAVRAGSPRAETRDRPFTVIEAMLFQWVNPKVWAVALAAASGYAAGLSPAGEAARLAVAFSGINLGVCTFWTIAGGLVGRYLSTDAAWRVFLRIMAAALALSAIAVFL
ncbi:Threonine/homoserine/homoserine lactone efflux protein [Tranquillimonas rosea]|uniref:Threonine/homoserine/homoserine lactone efflux protein n=1 Tax=Tranquillimonas rosea TaxID=641238 RepID=A0A1H9UGN9_9RHOB|nr:LysE family transporter [Tranquillimonas rosea]SES08700.1 Threonine/homoserine/homoserine lactone efflux protein [Tranquillimonas rosea]